MTYSRKNNPNNTRNKFRSDPPSLRDVYLPVAIGIAREAGNVLLDFAKKRQQLDVEIKTDKSPVCKADKAANNLIVTRLRDFHADIPIASEENNEGAIQSHKALWLPHTKIADDFMYWSVDPLDGTKDFLSGMKNYAVHITLIINGDPVLAVAHCPAHDATYYTTKATPSYKQIGNDTAELIQTKKHGDILTDVAFLNASPKENIEFYNLRRLQLMNIGIILPETPIFNTELPPALLLAQGDIDGLVKVGRDGKTAGYPWDNGGHNLLVRNAGGGFIDAINLFNGISFLKGAREKQHAYIGIGNRDLRNEKCSSHPSLDIY